MWTEAWCWNQGPALRPEGPPGLFPLRCLMPRAKGMGLVNHPVIAGYGGYATTWEYPKEANLS